MRKISYLEADGKENKNDRFGDCVAKESFDPADHEIKSLTPPT